MPKHASRRGLRASAIFATLVTAAFLMLGATGATVASAGGTTDEGTATGTTSPTPTETTSPSPTESASSTISPSADESADDEADHEADDDQDEADHDADHSIEGGHGTDVAVHGGIQVTVSADVDAVATTGGDVTFTFTVHNTADAQLEITALSDDMFGSLPGDADCHVGTLLVSGGSCSFTVVKHLSGNVCQHVVDVFTATGLCAGTVFSDVDSETVLFVSADEETHAGIMVTKTADVDSVDAAGGDVTFTFDVRNTGNAQLEITALSDDVCGDVCRDADCEGGAMLDAGASCSFTLTEQLTGTAGEHHVDVFTATGLCAGETVSDIDSESVLFVSTGSQTTGGIKVTKTADVDTIAATGGDVTFTFHVQNTSNGQLEITALSDDVFGTLSGDTDCEVGTTLASGGSCSFTLTENLSGSVGTHHIDVFTATGEV